MSAEASRLREARDQNVPWKKWGPYLSERQWGTVREDYSEDGNAWNYFSHLTLYQVAEEITRRLASMFLRDQNGHRPVNGGARKFQDDPYWRDCILFYEYFHGDNGAGLGASHQTGWTGVIARAMHLVATVTPEQLLKDGLSGFFNSIAGARVH
jgi:hypothetical protein